MAGIQLSRQQRRKVQRDAIERGRKVMARGLGPELGEAEALGIALIVHERLTDSSRPERAGEAAEMVETLLEKTLAKEVRGLDLGCRKGCTYCCSALVTCSAPEIFRVVSWLRQNAARVAAPIKLPEIAAEAARRRDLTPEQMFIERAPCPLLIEGACGVYPVRPIPCRSLFSMSSEACRLALEENAGEVPLVAAAMQKGEMARTLLLAAVSAAGLSDRGIELTAGVMAVIDKLDAEARWLAGENVFEGVLGGERSPNSRQAQDHIAKLAGALLA
jgi:hypothetical protein